MDKRAARKEFKSKKIPKGIFAVRCTASGEVWVGASTHLDSERNSLWYRLRNGLHQNKPLQAAWTLYGEPAFEYKALETLDDDIAPLLLKDALSERQKHWTGELHASAA
jgi:hypothetical protein